MPYKKRKATSSRKILHLWSNARFGIISQIHSPATPTTRLCGADFSRPSPRLHITALRKKSHKLLHISFFKPILRNITIAYYFTVYIALSAQKEI